MRPTLLFLLLCMTGVLVLRAGDTPETWELEMDKDGVRVYTQLDGVSPYKQVKITTTIDASMESVMQILMTFNQYRNWMHDVQQSYLMNQTDSSYFVFILEDATWPMQDRYQVSRIDVKKHHARSRINFKTVPNYIDKRTDAIQIKQYEGYWALEHLPDQRCSLEYVVVQHPGGHVPPWLANLHATENPFKSICSLKSIAEQNGARP